MNDCWHTNSAAEIVNLNDRTRYSLRDITGLFHLPGAAILTDVPLKTPRALYQGQNPNMRTIDLVLTVHGRTTEDVFDNLRLLYAHFWVDARDDELGTLRYIAMNGVDRWTYVTPPQGDDALIDQWWIARPGARGGMDLSIRLIAPDPTWMPPTASAPAGMNLAGAVPVNYSCTNSGDADAFPTITVGGLATNFQVTDDYGHTFQILNTVAVGQTLTCVLNPQRGLLSVSYSVGPTDWIGFRASGSRLARVAPGTHNLIFVGEAGDLGPITVTFYPRYSSHG